MSLMNRGKSEDSNDERKNIFFQAPSLSRYFIDVRREEKITHVRLSKES